MGTGGGGAGRGSAPGRTASFSQPTGGESQVPNKACEKKKK